MKRRISNHELEDAAFAAGLATQHDCGGFRLVRFPSNGGMSYVYPAGGVCPTATKRECMIFLAGYRQGKKDFEHVVTIMGGSADSGFSLIERT